MLEKARFFWTLNLTFCFLSNGTCAKSHMRHKYSLVQSNVYCLLYNISDARLVSRSSLCSGRLEMKHQGEWRPLIPKIREPNAMPCGEVACRQMGCGSLVSITYNTNNSDQHLAWEVLVSCTGSETTLRECFRSSSGRKVVNRTSTISLEVICAGKKYKRSWDCANCCYIVPNAFSFWTQTCCSVK